MTEATPVEGGMPTVYLTSYQDVSDGRGLVTRTLVAMLTLHLNQTPVFEAMVRNVAIMMRRADLSVSFPHRVLWFPRSVYAKHCRILLQRHVGG
jgi:hypothetical protein